MLSATIAAHSGDAHLTRTDGTSDVVQTGDALQPGDTITCPASAAVVVRSSTGAAISVGPDSVWQVPESWRPADEAEAHSDQDGVLDAAQLHSLAAHSHLFLSSGRAWEILGNQLAIADSESSDQPIWGLAEVEDTSLASALDQSSALLTALDQELAVGDSGNASARQSVLSLRESLLKLEQLLSSDLEENLEVRFSELFDVLRQAEELAIDGYVSHTPGSVATWEESGSAMQFTEMSPPRVGNDLGIMQAEAPVLEVLDIDLVLEGVTEHELDDVLTLNRDGGSLEVSVQSSGTAADSASIAVSLSSFAEPPSSAPWASGADVTSNPPE